MVVTVWDKTCAVAIEKKEIRLPNLRCSLITPFWGFPNDNLYRSVEVSYAHWSHHLPGKLNVQIKKTRSPDNAVEEAPFRIFYRVPERNRADVEKVLRARGKWRSDLERLTSEQGTEGLARREEVLRH